MFDVNHGFAFTVCICARIQQPQLLSEGRERLALSGCFENVPEMIKVPSSPSRNQHVVHAGDEVHCRDVKGE